jgi:archaellin
MNRFTTTAVIATFGLGLATLGYAADAPKEVPAKKVQSESNIVRGELIKVDGDFYVIKNLAGKELRIQVDNHTMTERGAVDNNALKPGDKVEAELTPQLGKIAAGTTMYVTSEGWGYARTLRKLRPTNAMIAQNVVKGEIVKIDGEFFVIKDAANKEVRIYVGNHTMTERGAVDGNVLKVGDKVEAELTPQQGMNAAGTAVSTEGWGYARSLKEVTPEAPVKISSN